MCAKSAWAARSSVAVPCLSPRAALQLRQRHPRVRHLGAGLMVANVRSDSSSAASASSSRPSFSAIRPVARSA